MAEALSWLAGFVMFLFALRYVYQIWKKEIDPTLSTWIIFLLGAGLSLATYAIAEKYDLQSGVLNTIDVVNVIIVLTAICVWGKRELRIRSFEKWYLAGIVAILLYGFTVGDAWGSNIYTQALISIGYFPTAQMIITEKRNTESFTAWGIALLAGLLALYPSYIAYQGGQELAFFYTLRSVILVTLMILLMAFYECRSRQRSVL